MLSLSGKPHFIKQVKTICGFISRTDVIIHITEFKTVKFYLIIQWKIDRCYWDYLENVPTPAICSELLRYFMIPWSKGDVYKRQL